MTNQLYKAPLSEASVFECSPNSSGDRRSPPELVVRRLQGTEAPWPKSSASFACSGLSSEEALCPLTGITDSRYNSPGYMYTNTIYIYLPGK